MRSVKIVVHVLAGLVAVQNAMAEPPPYHVLFGDDGNHIVGCPSPFNPDVSPFAPEMLAADVKESDVPGVEVHLFQPGFSWVPWWQSQVCPMAEYEAWLEQFPGIGLLSWDQYVLEGGDVVGTFVSECRKTGKASFVSLRMNDAHHIFRALRKEEAQREDILRAVCPFYGKHPEFRIGDVKDGVPWLTYLLDWSHPEVVEYRLAQIREVCAYDIDGLELDFMRHCALFNLYKTTLAERERIMDGFLKSVRRILDESTPEGKKRYLCVRIPGYIESYGRLGLNLGSFSDDGVDMVNVSGYYFSDLQMQVPEIRRELPDHIGVYSEIHFITAKSRSKVVRNGKKENVLRRTAPQQYCTIAHMNYARGGNGISTFNFHYYRGIQGDVHASAGPQPLPYKVFEHIGDAQWAAAQPQWYFLGWQYDHPKVEGRPLYEPFEKGTAQTCMLDMAPPTGGWKQGGRLRIQSENSLENSLWSVFLNGEKLSAAEDVSEPYENPYPTGLGSPDDYRAFTVPADVLKAGDNEIRIVCEETESPRTLFYLDIAVQ